MRRLIALALPALFSWLDPQGGAAQSEEPEMWAVVPVVDGPAQAEPAVELARTLEEALIALGVPVLSPDEIRSRFAAAHSEAPVVLAPDILAELRTQVQEATRLLALNRLPEALAVTEALRALGVAAQDYLRRELSRAHELFDVCVVTAAQIAAGGDRLEGCRHMLRCAQTFPGLKPVPEYHSPEVRGLYEDVLADVGQAKPAILLVRSAGPKPCMTRVNGISWGPSPAQVETSPAAVRVQLECDHRPGRVHRVVLRSGFNEVVIDPVFDDAVHAAGTRLHLRYAPPFDFEGRRTQDVSTLLRALKVSRLLAVVSGRQPALVLFDSQAQVRTSMALHGSAGEPALQEVVSSLLGPRGMGEAAAASAALGHRADRTRPEPASAPALHVPAPALPILAPSRDLAWLSPLAIGIGYALSVGGSAFALSERYFVRRDGLGGVFDLEHYSDTGSLGLGFMIGGSTLTTAAELLTLPESAGVPLPAWIVGGVGAATALAGTVSILAGNDCVGGDDRPSCTGIHRDPLFGPLLVMQSVPLLAVPGTYLLAGALGEHAMARVVVDDTGPQLAVQGSF